MLVATFGARLPGAEGQIDEVAREAEKLVAEGEAPGGDFDPVVEQLLIPGELLKPDDIAASVDFVEELQRGDAGVHSGVPTPAIDQRHQEPGAGQAQTLLQVEFGLQRDLPGLLSVLAQAAGEIQHRFVDAGERHLDAKIVELRADGWPFAEKIWRRREIVRRQRG